MKLGPYPLDKMWQKVELLDIQPMKCVFADIYDIHLYTRCKIDQEHSKTKKLRHTVFQALLYSHSTCSMKPILENIVYNFSFQQLIKRLAVTYFSNYGIQWKK